MKKILVVDDQQNIRELVRMTLEVGGHTVLEARNGDEALARVHELAPDVMLLDIMMPGSTDGLEVCRRVKGDARLAALKVILLTARGQDKDREAGKAAGADAYMAKPFSPRQLLQVISDLA